MHEQVKVHYQDKPLTPEEYIENTNKMRGVFCTEYFKKIKATNPNDIKKRSTFIKIEEKKLKKILNLTYREGEIKVLEMIVNLLIEHQNDDPELLLGSIELALVSKVPDNKEMLNSIISVVETVRANYRNEEITPEQISDAIDNFWKKH